ncbi:MAG TPA: hypothetical protein VLD61_08800 [Methylomirabilota bacterium]|nr:hypothetical protein [Methylomirabilota bacterium]
MVLMLFVVVTIAFLVSILPFFFPGSLIGALGAGLNGVIGETLLHWVDLTSTPLIERVPGAYGGPAGMALTFSGVLALYLPILIVLGLILRGK